MNYCPACGTQTTDGAQFCGSCGTSVALLSGRIDAAAHLQPSRSWGYDDQAIRRIADYERISATLWLILGVIQILMIVTIIAGVWNVIAAWSRFKVSPMIRQRDSRVPAFYEGITQLVIIGVINLLFGGVIGVLFVVFDFVIRDMVLNHQHLFANVVQD
jgi:hypothetical protein